MKKKFFLPALIIVGLLFSGVVLAVIWPAGLTRHSDILMPNLYEPSGLAWNSVTNKLFTVSDKGKITMMNMDGSNQDTVTMPSYMDFEAITIVNPNTKKVYIGIENPDTITEYDLTPLAVQDPNKAGTEVVGITGAKTWNLTGVLTGADNQGLEGLTFVPNGYHPFANSNSGGLFYAGVQRSPIRGDGNEYNNYLLYAFDIDLNTSGKIVQWYGITLPTSIPNSDISDLYFNKDTGLLYVLFDSHDRLVEMKTDGTVIQDYSNVPVADQEGVLIKTNYPSLTADIYLASDTGKSIGWYSGYPVDYDFDKDGVKTSVDCNDNDKAVWKNQAYYKDSDGDGLGFGSAELFCRSTPPDKYSTNNLDKNDSDFDNDGVIITSDCNDNDVTVWQTKIYYKDVDGDGVGTGVAESLCKATAPANYVFTSDVDCNDNDKTVSVNQSYYKDADGDGMGFGLAQSFCLATAPSGYATNALDKNDNDHDNDGFSASEDCDDNDNTVFGKEYFYIDYDGDGLGTGSPIAFCPVAPTSGYADNPNDSSEYDFDNDGYKWRADCDDHNAKYYKIKKYYQDADGDGLGNRKVFDYYCVPPVNYVTNGKDNNDLIKRSVYFRSSR